ncbi:L-piperidine-6-carboxylate dehydrogenase [Roseinatronobacter bogoriensis]|uniref:aldehyde dehydrogenase (NAD(+)) n=1 Tax=Roseinatronobacter bogoriensis subsp. barguzinensis TaxID=441209 RepID=A0A2K8KJD9_9RHOB|nr:MULTISPECIES: aldehyde dehydrogenase family protein [Rhodobaca]ATX67048.1 aldehyde dehydrogenase family protein [Rhodobaca barguzinensis]MBB4206556.1 aldehyde dehydrogenase (NAD+) [Rhodobaca bogoriensis DSM 18756]TDW41299.1 aldehyde dehydrogenase (NAD+) [Rhodobaca barguzinensis]TDY74523.1 aldehyde dehydrogenase (NAD+) [Rhodobaca bogoriensis DSM 18756]
MTHDATLAAAGLTKAELTGGTLAVYSPIDGAEVAQLHETPADEMAVIIARAQSAFRQWRNVPAPRRGELVRLLGEELRNAKAELGALVTLDAGKITSEGLGEVQEMIDICDFAVGLSRQLYGLTIASERPGHRMAETWHPMGPVGIISAFNFPVAVWSWNAALALVCGNPIIWKPSEKSPLTAMAAHKCLERALERFGDAPEGLSQLVIGGPELGAALVDSRDVPIVSATGSTRMGSLVGPKVMARFGRPILELGGNNAMIVAPSADLDMAVRAIVFSAVGTAGQRCTSLRRLIVHNSIREGLVEKLKAAYATLPVGDPRTDGTLVGPLVDNGARARMLEQLDRARADGGTVHGGASVSDGVPQGGAYVTPALVDMPAQTDCVREETFAPILYVMGYDTLEEAIEMQNDVPQGLSSCIFTLNLREAETFLSASGSDCGIANVNIGPSGAEIGGAFGGEKETGGGRESGSDAWKGYMRRQTCTVNYSAELPLAQGVRFDI